MQELWVDQWQSGEERAPLVHRWFVRSQRTMRRGGTQLQGIQGRSWFFMCMCVFLWLCSRVENEPTNKVGKIRNQKMWAAEMLIWIQIGLL
jgi:hypothetical protein